jgi:putative hydrolase of the HAD superfamily
LKIKAIVFDYGQVISFPQDVKAIDRIAKLAGVEREKFEPVYFTVRKEFDRGTINARQYYREILSRFAVTVDNAVIDEMIEVDFKSWQNINPETVTLMEEVKKAGYILGILSNMPHEYLAWARSIPVFSLPNIIIFSCEVNLIKPEKAIYEKLLSDAGVKGEEVVFFDDIPENVKSARSLGIQAFVWETCKDARQKLSTLEVKL